MAGTDVRLSDGADEVVDADGAAALLRISVPTLNRLVRAGKIRVVRVGPRSTRFRIGDLNAFIEANATVVVTSDGLPKRSRARR